MSKNNDTPGAGAAAAADKLRTANIPSQKLMQELQAKGKSTILFFQPFGEHPCFAEEG